MRRAIFALAALLLALVVVEAACRGILALFPRLDDPWAARSGSRFNASFVRTLESNLSTGTVCKRKRLYRLDPDRFWALNPGVEMEVENTFYETRGEPLRWDIRTNSMGFRADECPPGFQGTRILCLGDSCTFGLRTRQSDTYASRLQALLDKGGGGGGGAGGRSAHVLNAGVPGYTSFQGRRLLEGLLGRYPADIVTLAFGANDLELDTMSDAERGRLAARPERALARVLGGSGFGRLLRGIAGRARPPSSAQRQTPRVSDEEYRSNLTGMIDMAEAHGARVLLLDLVFIGPRYEGILEAIARERGLDLFNGRREFERAFERVRRGELYRKEASEWIEFYKANVLSYRPIYYGEEFYRKRYASDREQRKFTMLMADPIHPNAIGHRIIADWLAPRCRGGKR